METEKAIHFVELAQRTLVNYDFIFNAKETGESVFEVTQLITGLISIAVWIKEEYFTWDSKRKLEILYWSKLKRKLSLQPIAPNYIRQDKAEVLTNYYQLLWKLRNGLAHGNFEFTSTNGVISGLKIWNISSGGVCNWRCTIHKEILEEIARYFVSTFNQTAFDQYKVQENDHGIDVYKCSICNFLWISNVLERDFEKPKKCPCSTLSNPHDAQWKIEGKINIQNVQTRPPNCI